MEEKMLKLTKDSARKWNIQGLVNDHNTIMDRADQKKGVFVAKKRTNDIDDNFNLDDFGTG